MTTRLIASPASTAYDHFEFSCWAKTGNGVVTIGFFTRTNVTDEQIILIFLKFDFAIFIYLFYIVFLDVFIQNYDRIRKFKTVRNKYLEMNLWYITGFDYF